MIQQMDNMVRSRGTALGNTLVALVAAGLATVIVFAVLLPATGRARGTADAAVCGANLRGVMQAMSIYSRSNDGAYPIAGLGTPDGSVQGFAGPRGVEAASRDDPGMMNNSTASLWMLVREGSATPKGFICPASADERDTLQSAAGNPLPLAETWDFAGASHLSYSTINMFHPANDWASSVAADWVLMGDNNNAPFPHGQSVRATLANMEAGQIGARQISKTVNSGNHGGRGQNVGLGDGSVRFVEHPFAGPNHDNVYAMVKGGAIVRPQLSNRAGDGATDASARDVVLIPVTGNAGVSLSGADAARGHWKPETGWIGPAIVPTALLVGLAVFLLLRHTANSRPE